MRWIFLSTICFVLIGCNSINFTEIEFISTSGRALDYNNTDSIILGIYINSYAKIDNKGNCNIVRGFFLKGQRFNSFTIDKKLFKTINNRLININSDTILTDRSKSGSYDGPIIELIVHKKDGSINKLTFISSKRTDKDFLNFYYYIDSISTKINNDRFIDTVKLLRERDILIDVIKNKALKSALTFNRDTIAIIK